MSFRVWKIWFRSLPASLKWFVILILIRPLVDSFYYLKEVSPLISPPYIVGILTPVLCVWGIIENKKKPKSGFGESFTIWFAAQLIAIIPILLIDTDILSKVNLILKLTLVFYLFYFIRSFLKGGYQLDGLLQTFLYSALIVLGIFLFEIFSGPIRVEITRGSVERIQGSFADVMNYAIYATLSLVITAYFYLKTNNKKQKRSFLIWFIFAVALGILVLFRINHLSSFGVFIAILIWFLLLTRNPGFIILVAASAIVFYLTNDSQVYPDTFSPILEGELEVLEGERDVNFLFHGRFGRWIYSLETYNNMPPAAKVLGVSYSMRDVYWMVTGGIHNDFLRILFSAGIIGLVSYIFILTRLVLKSLRLPKPQLFLGISAFIMLFLYSISTVPTFYAPLLYIILSIMVYITLPYHPFRRPAATASKYGRI